MLYVHPPKQDVDFFVRQQDGRGEQMGRPYGLITNAEPRMESIHRIEEEGSPQGLT